MTSKECREEATRLRQASAIRRANGAGAISNAFAMLADQYDDLAELIALGEGAAPALENVA